ncbi:MAG: polysaccharide biosynthesis protein, partial [Oscillospiraceae bacterium]
MNKNAENSYSKLFSNTIVFAVGTFSSKILVFLLLPLYTRALTQGQLGTVDLIVQMANLMIPVVTVSVAEAVIRFGLDSSHKK